MQTTATISSITPEKAHKILHDNGLQCSLEEAAGILEFLVKLAQSALEQDEEEKIGYKKAG